MFRFLHSFLLSAALLGLVACMQEPLEPAGSAKGGPPVEVTFEVGLRNALTKADSTPFDDASGTWRLYVAAFSKADGSLNEASLVGGAGYQPAGTLSDGSASIHLRLPKGQEYRVIFFAEKEDAYEVVFADGPQAGFSFKSGLKANDPGLDAFYSVVDVTASKTSYDVTLKRPFAQLNVLVPKENVPEGQTSFRSRFSVQAPTSFDLYNSAAGTTLSTVDFAENAIAAEPFGKYADAAKPYTWIGTAYVLVPASGTVDVKSFFESGMEAAVAPGPVPVRVNGRTNLVGSLYGSELDLSFTVQVGSGFDGSSENPVEAEDTEITIAGGATYTEASPLTIDATSGAVKVTLRVNGDDFTTVNGGAAEGEQVSAASEDTDVVTAAVNGNDVVITPVGNGTTAVVVSTPSYTKAAYKAQTFRIPVKVEGLTPIPPTPGSDAFVRVTDVSELEDGDEILIVYEKGSLAMGAQMDNYRNKVEVTISDDEIANPSADVAIITLEEGEGGWYMAVDGGYLAASEASNKNYLLTVEEKSDYALWFFDIDETEAWMEAYEGDRAVIGYNPSSPRFSCYSADNPQQPVAIYARSGADNSRKILEKTGLGCYLSDHTWSYAAGTDQYVREYDGTALTFALLKPADSEQLVLSGFSDTMQAGDAVTMTLDWKKGTDRVLFGSYTMSVVAIDNKKVWIADKRGNGFVIKK